MMRLKKMWPFITSIWSDLTSIYKTDVLTSMPAALPVLWPPNASLN